MPLAIITTGDLMKQVENCKKLNISVNNVVERVILQKCFGDNTAFINLYYSLLDAIKEKEESDRITSKKTQFELFREFLRSPEDSEYDVILYKATVMDLNDHYDGLVIDCSIGPVCNCRACICNINSQIRASLD